MTTHFRSRRRINAANSQSTLAELTREGITREELLRRMEDRPLLWGRFEDFVNALPSERDAFGRRKGPIKVTVLFR
jgi:hypothetical protein